MNWLAEYLDAMCVAYHLFPASTTRLDPYLLACLDGIVGARGTRPACLFCFRTSLEVPVVALPLC